MQDYILYIMYMVQTLIHNHYLMRAYYSSVSSCKVSHPALSCHQTYRVL